MEVCVLGFCALALACAKGSDDLGELPGDSPDAATSSPDARTEDLDGDGFVVECDDTNPAINPNAAEICDGVDNNCDGNIDEDAVDAVSYFSDVDGDGYGDPATEVVSCTALADHVSNDLDCYDGNAAAKPGQTGFFTTHRGDGSFDYDCSDAVDSSTQAGNCSWTGSGCGYAPGWDGAAPTCGTSGTVIDGCLEICIGFCICEPSTGSAVNECR